MAETTKVYHYTRLEDWPSIKRGSYKSDHKPGLGPSRGLGTVDPQAFKTYAVFALTDPTPENWTSNPHFPRIWDHLRANIGLMLLEVDVDPTTDKSVYVVDRGHMEGFLYQDKDGIPPQYLHPTRREAEHAYLESKVPFSDFLSGKYDYSLPEVIFEGRVPIEKISVPPQQPFLSTELTDSYNDYVRDFLWRVENTPELKPFTVKNKAIIDRAKQQSEK